MAQLIPLQHIYSFVHILNFCLKVSDRDILITLNQGVGLGREDSLLAVEGGSLGAKQTKGFLYAAYNKTNIEYCVLILCFDSFV